MPHRSSLIPYVLGALWLFTIVGCGRQPEPAQSMQAADGRALPSQAPAIEQPETTASVASTSATAADPSRQIWLDLDEQKKQLSAEVERVREDLQLATTDTEKKSARQRMREAQVRMSKLSRYRTLPPAKNVPEEWQQMVQVERNTSEADLIVRVGDMDNLGFGWPAGFDPLSGESTPRHSWPWRPEADDPPGTDRVMVLSGMRERNSARHDGYSGSTDRPYNDPEPLTIAFSLDGITLDRAVLQLFVDDFQAPKFGNRYEVRLDGREAPDLSASINALSQTGPIGKLLTLQLLSEYNDLLVDGELVVSIDDPHSNIGDGFALDFARLLINPKQFRYVGTVRGVAQDKQSGEPLAGVLVSAGNVQQIETGEDGRFELTNVPAGMVVTTGTHPEYSGDSQAFDLQSDQAIDLVLELEKNRTTSAALADQLEVEGKVDLYGIYFDLDKATLKAESEPTLRQVRQLLIDRPTLHLVVAGHTDSEGTADYNLDLSRRRADSVVTWLSAREIDASRLEPQGVGEGQPVADNATPAGRALNRRVEIRDAKRN